MPWVYLQRRETHELITGLSEEDALTSSLPLSNSRQSKFERKDQERYAKGDETRIPVGGVALLLLTMERIAMDRGTTVAQVALNYIFCNDVIPISGARTAAQYVDNMGEIHWHLMEEEVTQMENEADDLEFLFRWGQDSIEVM